MPKGMRGTAGKGTDRVLSVGQPDVCGKGGPSYVGGALHIRGKRLGNRIFYRL